MDELDPTRIALYIRLAIFGIFFILILIFVLRRTKGDSSRAASQLSDKKIQPELVSEADNHILASLTVLESDDPTMLNKVVYVLKYPFTLGRNSNNDFSFPNDLAVSNFHARLITSANNVLLSEIIVTSSGRQKAPTYGTFVNGEPLRTDAVSLTDQDEIRLGSRLRLLFELVNTNGLPGTFDVKTGRKHKL